MYMAQGAAVPPAPDHLRPRAQQLLQRTGRAKPAEQRPCLQQAGHGRAPPNESAWPEGTQAQLFAGHMDGTGMCQLWCSHMMGGFWGMRQSPGGRGGCARRWGQGTALSLWPRSRKQGAPSHFKFELGLPGPNKRIFVKIVRQNMGFLCLFLPVCLFF